MLSKLGKHLPSIHLRHHDVEHNDGGRDPFRARKSFWQAANPYDTVSCANRVSLKEAPRLRVVIQHQNRQLLHAWKLHEDGNPIVCALHGDLRSATLCEIQGALQVLVALDAGIWLAKLPCAFDTHLDTRITGTPLHGDSLQVASSHDCYGRA
ncbi:MAG: hypothetical protein K6V36_03325 [Anaerolineae bacterium]|nr:hypothetical protein [Anaerolineae bacterium]